MGFVQRLQLAEVVPVQQDDPQHPLLRPGGPQVLIPQLPVFGLKLPDGGQAPPLLLPG